jgi:hypothetical protein
LEPLAEQVTDLAAMRKGTRDVYLPDRRERRPTPIYDEALFGVGASIPGPSVIEALDTTIYVPDGVVATRDPYTNIVLEEQS